MDYHICLAWESTDQLSNSHPLQLIGVVPPNPSRLPFVQVVSPWSPSILASNQNASIGISVGQVGSDDRISWDIFSGISLDRNRLVLGWTTNDFLHQAARVFYVSFKNSGCLKSSLFTFLQFWKFGHMLLFPTLETAPVAVNQGFNLRCKCHWAPKDSSRANIHDPESYGWHSCHPDCCPFQQTIPCSFLRCCGVICGLANTTAGHLLSAISIAMACVPPNMTSIAVVLLSMANSYVFHMAAFFFNKTLGV